MASPTPPRTGSNAKVHLLPPGTELRGYTILETAGYGGMGAVYRATFAGHEYALKVAFQSSSEDDEVALAEQRARIEREFSSVHQLSHPNILKPTEFFLWPDPASGTPVIVMPFVEGRTLSEYTREKHPTLRAILLRLLKPIAEAVGYLHGKGIIHRDIKSANIHVRESDGVPLLMDFGIARSQASGTLTHVAGLYGTPELTSPENIRHIVSLDSPDGPFVPTPQSDLFSLGAAFFSVLTSQLPFAHLAGYTGGSSFVVNAKFQQALAQYQPVPPSALNPQLPQEVDPLFLRLMARDPEQRYASAEDVVLELSAFLRIPPGHPVFDAPFVPPPKPAAAPSPAVAPARTAGARPRALGSLEPTVGPVIASPASRLPSLAAPSMAMPLSVASAEAPVSARPPSAAMSASRSSQHAAEFRPPTVAAPAKVAPFVDPLPPPVAPVAAMGSEPPLPTAFRQLKERLNHSAGTTSRRLPLMLGGGALALLLVVLAIRGSATPPPTGPASLLDEPAPTMAPRPLPVPPPELSRPTAPPELARNESPAALGPTPAPQATAQPEPVEEVYVGPAPAPAAPHRRRPSPDAKAVDEMIEREYGGARPVIEPDGNGKKEAVVASTKPSWLKGGMSGGASNTKKRAYGVPTGAELAVQLQRPLDSRLTSSGPVIARLRRSLVVGGAFALPAGTMVYGTASANGAGRFDIRFARLRLPDNTEVPFEGLAYDLNDKKAGLHPSHRIQPEQRASSSPSVGEAVVKSVAAVALNQVAGSEVSDMARTGGQVVLNHSDSEPQGSSQPTAAILLDAPYDFLVFVTAPF